MALSDIYQKASLVQIPSGYKAADDKLYSVVPSNGDGDFTIDSDADATRVNKDGLIETTVADQARLNYDPANPQDPHLLLEPTRTNLITRSYEFGAIWAKGGSTTVTTNFSTAPDGTNTASRLQMPSGFGTYLSIAASMSSGTSYSLTFYIKNNGGQALDFGVWQTSSGGTKTDSLLVTPTDEWVRYELNFTADSNSNYVFLDNNNNSSSVDCLIWGAQLEAGSYPTSYIPTSGSAVTRTADTCKLENFTNAPTDYPFTVFCEMEIPKTGQKGFAFSFIDISTSTNYSMVGYNIDGGGNFFAFERRENNNIYNQKTSSTYEAGRHKIAVKYISSTQFKGFVNGAQVVDRTHTSLPFNSNINDFLLGQLRVSGDTGHRNSIDQFMVFNEELTDAELITLTT